MRPDPSSQIHKSDFMLFCEAPRHLWVKKHGTFEVPLSDFNQHLVEEGNKVESLGYEYLSGLYLDRHPDHRLLWQHTYSDGPFLTRLDGLVFKPGSNSYDLYEIKSSTGVDQDILYDVAFQAVILERALRVDHYFVLHPDKEYIRSGELDLAGYFTAEDISERVNDLKALVEQLREEALRVVELDRADEAGHCLSPKECPCPSICHPDLPGFSIYDIPRLNRPKKIQLLQDGIRSAKDIPASFDLNPKQRLVADMAKTGQPYIDRKAIAAELKKMIYPLYFLDYETCLVAVPQFDGYRPQQQIVFQYSLHAWERPGDEPRHCQHISLDGGDPSLPLLKRLAADLGPSGTVIVWNKSFEKKMNEEMAKLHPEYATFLEQLNARLYDLSDIVSRGYYLHPGFKGSWSIKKVLPVLVPDCSYDGLEIGEGTQASLAWWKIIFGQVDPPEKEQLVQALLRYCELDSRAMLEIYKKIQSL